MIPRIAVEVEAGRRLPGITPRIALVVIAAGAFLVAPPVPAAIAVALALVGAVVPALLVGWGAILLVVLAQLAHPAVVGDPRIHGALALAHLLHVVAALTLVVDPRGTMQLRILIRPLLRFAAIQLPAQALLAGALLLQGARTSADPLLAPVLAAVGLAVAVILIVRAARRG